MMTPIWRSVRSDAQLSCTDTQFQKCSQGGKNGSKPPILSISMAYNVISHSKNRNRLFYYANSAPELRNHQKNTPHLIGICSIFSLVWYILDATWWILMFRRFRICMAKGGSESARPSYGRPKLTLISWRKKITSDNCQCGQLSDNWILSDWQFGGGQL